MAAPPFVVAILVLPVLALVIGAVLILIRNSRAEQQSRERSRRDAESALQREVREGRRMPDGAPRCPLCPVPTPAKARPLVLVRDEGLIAWLRARVGAPVRWRIQADSWAEPKWCEAHGALAVCVFAARLGHDEQHRLERVRDAEAQLARYERTGLDEELVAVVAQEERRATSGRRRARPDAKVVQLRPSAAQA